MPVGALLRYAREALFSKPSADRDLLRLVRKHRVERIVELGICSKDRTEALLKAAAGSASEGVTYCGVDPFEQREDADSPLSLIAVHRAFSNLPAAVRLVPGDPAHALASIANSLSDSDLILLPTAIEQRPESPLWFYLPRMCHPGTLVLELRQIDAETQEWRQWPLAEIESRALAARDRDDFLRPAA